MPAGERSRWRRRRKQAGTRLLGTSVGAPVAGVDHFFQFNSIIRIQLVLFHLPFTFSSRALRWRRARDQLPRWVENSNLLLDLQEFRASGFQFELDETKGNEMKTLLFDFGPKSKRSSSSKLGLPL